MRIGSRVRVKDDGAYGTVKAFENSGAVSVALDGYAWPLSFRREFLEVVDGHDVTDAPAETDDELEPLGVGSRVRCINTERYGTVTGLNGALARVRFDGYLSPHVIERGSLEVVDGHDAATDLGDRYGRYVGVRMEQDDEGRWITKMRAVAAPEPAPEPKYPEIAPSVGAALWDGTTTMVTAESGASKGQKIVRFDLIPAEALSELAACYGKGEQKYPAVGGKQNYLNGYAWSLSVAAMFRHVYKWLLGQSWDDEDGIHHLAHACWHLMTLMTFETRGLGTDDSRKD